MSRNLSWESNMVCWRDHSETNSLAIEGDTTTAKEVQQTSILSINLTGKPFDRQTPFDVVSSSFTCHRQQWEHLLITLFSSLPVSITSLTVSCFDSLISWRRVKVWRGSCLICRWRFLSSCLSLPKDVEDVLLYCTKVRLWVRKNCESHKI